MMARPGRTAAVVGGLVAFGAITLMGMLAGSASAMAPGRCTENVNVRAEPSSDARIVALCEQGTAVETGRIRDGYVQLTDLGGWASAEYVSVDGAAPAAGRATPPATDDADSTGAGNRSGTDGSATPAPRTTAPSADAAPADRSESGRNLDGDDDADTGDADDTDGSEDSDGSEDTTDAGDAAPAGLGGGLLG